MPPEIRALLHASELLTGAAIAAKDGKRIQPGDEGPIEDGALVYETRKVGRTIVPGRVLWTGPSREIPQAYRKKLSSSRTRNLQGRFAVLPGLIDCHTHLVFGGDRPGEFASRCAGATYEEIAARGGGILSSVRATREASESKLLNLAIDRAEEARSFGVRTLEVKSGYGLDLETEKKCLRVAASLGKRFPDLTVSATYLGAHAFPKEKTRQDYISEILSKHLPAVAKGKLARHCDVFLDRGYYSREEARVILLRARELGLRLKLHGDELSDQDSALLACELGADSVDHLLCVNEKGIHALAESTETTAVLLPLTAHYLKTAQAPARKLIDQGARVAVSTDFNPGSSPCNSLPTALHFAALQYGMNRAELLASVTFNAARALALHGRKGSLTPGKDADFWVLPFGSFEESYYRLAWTPAP